MFTFIKNITSTDYFLKNHLFCQLVAGKKITNFISQLHKIMTNYVNHAWEKIENFVNHTLKKTLISSVCHRGKK